MTNCVDDNGNICPSIALGIEHCSRNKNCYYAQRLNNRNEDKILKELDTNTNLNRKLKQYQSLNEEEKLQEIFDCKLFLQIIERGLFDGTE